MGLLVSTTLLGMAIGCGGSTAATSPPTTATTASEDDATADLVEHHRHHRHGGVTLFIAMSLETLGVSPDQRAAIEKIRADLHAAMEPAHVAEQAFVTTLADGIDAGNIDTAKVDAAVAKVTAAAATVHDASADALNRLHAALSPVQRATLVDKVEAHWEVWRQANHEEQPGKRERGGRLANLTEQLSLPPDQVNRISAALKTARTGRPVEFDPKKGDAHVQAFSKAFASDSFDAKSVTSNANAELARHGATRMALFYETVTPLLTPEQRTKLAEHLRGHANYQSASSAK